MGKNSSHNEIQISVNGKNGVDGYSGSDGSNGHGYGNHGEHGQNGYHGTDGQSGENITLTLSANSFAQTVDIQDESNKHYQLHLGSPDDRIRLNARGGRGGNGGNGGKGGEGARGTSGRSASYHTRGEDGGNGGNGGDGGNGGRGGNGGNGGHITVNIPNPEDIDLLALVEPEFTGGINGNGGRYGERGRGGPGGEGGSSFTWNEPYTYFDGEGHQQTGYRTEYAQGGSDGSRGYDGTDGRSGSDGARGKNGVYTINVSNLGVFHERYAPIFQDFAPIRSNDGVIEPGEHLSIYSLNFSNPSQMPTPRYIDIGVQPNLWIDFRSEYKLALQQSLNPSQSITLNQPLAFDIKRNDTTAIDQTFSATTDVNLTAELPRIHKQLQDVMPQNATLEIRRPAEISMISAPQTIAPLEEAPFAFQIRNISDVAIGSKTPQARSLIFTIEIENNNAVQLAMYNPNTGLTSEQKSYQQNISYLKPNDTFTFGGTFKFNNVETPPYTKVNVKFNLQLGDLNTNEPHKTQERNYNLQLADHYNFRADADFVLVTNNQTSLDTIAQWERVAEAFGTNINICNASLDGLSYTEKRRDDGSFTEALKDKVVVILNNDYKDDQNKTVKSTQHLDVLEIANAAQKNNVSTYVIGDGFDLPQATTPLAATNENIKVKKHFLFWQKPKSEQLIQKAEELNNNILKKDPTAREVAVYKYQPVQLNGCFIHTWELGDIQLRPGLNRKQTHIAGRNHDGKNVDNGDIYNVIKLLPFGKKLQYLNRSVNNATHYAIVKAAILSDLTDELRTFGAQTWKGDFTKAKLKESLKFLNTFVKFDFNPRRDEEFIAMLLQYDYLLKRLPTTKDKWLFPTFKLRRIIANLCEDSLTKMLKKYYPNRKYTEAKNALKNMWKDASKEAVYKAYAYPEFAIHTTYDNQSDVSEVINQAQLPNYQPKMSKFKDSNYFFQSNQARDQSIAEQAALCQFELPKPSKQFSLKR